MQAYVAFWRAKDEHRHFFPSAGKPELSGYFKSFTKIGTRRTVLIDWDQELNSAGRTEKGIEIDYNHAPAEADVDEKIAGIAVVKAAAVTERVKVAKGSSGLGLIDFYLPDGTAQDIENSFNGNVRFVKFSEYASRGL